MEFIISGLLLLIYSIHTFCRNKLLLPSVVFCIMWGIAFMLCGLIQSDYIFADVKQRFNFVYVNQYCLYFAISSIVGFKIAHLRKHTFFYDCISACNLREILDKYRWIMYITFLIGIICIFLFIIHFGITSYSQYRLVFVTTEKPPLLSFIFRIGNYSVLLASIYVLLLGLYHGKTKVDNKELITNFILFSTPLMSTGGRLFIFYFFVYYLSSFSIGRYSEVDKSFISKEEMNKLIPFFALLFSLVSFLAILRTEGEQSNSKASHKYLYFTDGIRTTDFCIKKFEGNLSYEYGKNSFFPKGGDNMKRFRKYMSGGPLGATVYSILVPLYLDFGMVLSLFVWCFIAFIIEWIALLMIHNITIINFVIYLLLTKIMYESVIFNCLSQNYYFIQLIVLLYIFRKRIFPELY